LGGGRSSESRLASQQATSTLVHPMPTRFTGRVPRLGSKSGVLNPVGVLPLDWLLCAAERNASLSQRRPGRDPETGAGAHFGFRGGPASAHGLLWSWRAPYFGTILSDVLVRERGLGGYGRVCGAARAAGTSVKGSTQIPGNTAGPR